MAYEMVMPYHLHMPSYFLETFTEYPIEDLYHDRDNCFRQQILKNYIQSFLLDIYDKTHRLFLMKRPEGISRQEELFKRFIQLVHKHCTTQREVSFYANKLFITPRYLSTVIQNVTNTTAKSIIDKHVIQEIKVLLKSTNLSVQEISNQLCFPDQSFFGRYFKKHTGLSPLQYRNQN
ncbi:helix-turn-helix domain-containing protein, partial [Phocaeicola vulgatus]|nr:helix-turn-helix domain-containing protein [Phocaeicola vulgatus]